MDLTKFFVSSLISSALILVILLIKKLFRRHIGVKWQYYMGFLLFLLLAVPFIPSQFINIGGLVFERLRLWTGPWAKVNPSHGGINHLLYGENWLNDFTVSVSQSAPGYINGILAAVWVAGAGVCLIVTIRCNGEIKAIKQSTEPVESGVIQAVFRQCKSQLHITKDIVLSESALVQSPIAIGLWKIYIVFPARLTSRLSPDEIRYILLHELCHYKNKDILINYIICLFQIIYWFNPLVGLAFKEMRRDREIACDASVLSLLDQRGCIAYGRVILFFAEKFSQPSRLSVAAEMGGSRNLIRARIEKIAAFTKESKHTKIKSMAVFMLAALLIMSQAPLISAMAFEGGHYHFQAAHVIYEDLSAYFDGYEGSFVLYDLQTDQYSIYDKSRSETRVSPDSTYKIYSALIALETNHLRYGDTVRHWDGTNYPIEVWNRDQALASAMESSVNWYFQELDKAVGLKTLQSYYRQIGYGNSNLSGGIDRYWMESSLRISPVEQVKLLKEFYENDWGFEPEHIETVKNAIKLSAKDGAVLYGKTGTGMINGKNANGWFIGFVEAEGRTCIFAANITGKDSAGGSAAAGVTLSILNSKGIY